MIKENRASKYFLYAIGEILLVVIGILIALSINNNNLDRQKEAKVEALMTEILKDLSIDIIEANRILEYDIVKDSLLDRVSKGQVTADSYNTEIGFYNLVTDTDIMTFSDNAYINLAQSIDEIPDKYKAVIIGLNKLHLVYKVDVKKWNTKLLDYVEKILENWANTKPWFSKRTYRDNEGTNYNDEMMEFYLKDPFYKNDVALYQIYMTQNHMPAVIDYKHQAILSYKAISKLIDQNKELPTFITSYIADLSPETLQQYEGTYNGVFDNINMKIQIKSEENKLNITINSEFKMELFPKSEIEFFSKEYSYIKFLFHKNSKGEIVSFKYVFKDQELELLKSE